MAETLAWAIYSARNKAERFLVSLTTAAENHLSCSKLLDHMEVVEGDRGCELVFRNGTDIGFGHVHGHPFNERSGSPKAGPELLHGLGPVDITYKDHSLSVQVQYHRQILLPSTDKDLVDINLAHRKTEAGEISVDPLIYC
jgi:hypothetical protein